MCVCVSVCLFIHSNINISAARGPITTKFDINHHWGGEKAALGFGRDRIRTLVSMATNNSHRHSSAFNFDRIVFFLASKENSNKISKEFEFQPDLTWDFGVSCP